MKSKLNNQAAKKEQKILIEASDVNFENLVLEINGGIYVCDVDGKFIFVNNALAGIFGFSSPAEIIGKSFEAFIPAERWEEVKAVFQNPHSAKITSRLLSQDETTTYIEIKSAPFIKDGAHVGNQGLVHDITKFKQFENTNMKLLSTLDPQTNIYYRTFLQAEMKRLERGRQFPISIVAVKVGNLPDGSGLEDFKDGDKVLKRVAEILFNTFRGDDIIARTDENDFAVLLPNVDENAIKTILKRIQLNLSKNNVTEGEPALEFFIGTSTTPKRGSLTAGLEKAEAIAHLSKKKLG